MQVDKIEIGTVVDHIKAGRAAKVMKLLGIGEEYSHRVGVMLNVPSKKMGTKDIVKIEGKVVSPETANIVALISAGATINIIKGGKVEKKYEVKLPDELQSQRVVRCPNPNCISAEYVQFFKREKEKYRCHYCERLFKAEELV